MIFKKGDRIQIKCVSPPREWEGVRGVVLQPGEGQMLIEITSTPPPGWRIGSKVYWPNNEAVIDAPLTILEESIVAYIASEKKELGIS